MLNAKQLLTLQMFGGQLLRFSVSMNLQHAVEYSNSLCSGRNMFTMQICQLIGTVLLFRLSIVKA